MKKEGGKGTRGATDKGNSPCSLVPSRLLLIKNGGSGKFYLPGFSGDGRQNACVHHKKTNPFVQV